MASVSTDRNGNRRIQFVADDGRRRAIRLGKIDMKSARDIARRVDILNVAKIMNREIERETAEWLGGIGDKLHAKLAAVGLLDPRSARGAVPTLGKFIADFIAKRAIGVASTTTTMRIAANRLTSYFGDDAPLDSITAGQADEWLAWMSMEKKYAGATIGRTVKRAKQFFRAAVRLELLRKNPFEDLKAPSQANESRKFFITQEVAAQVLNACPDMEWRLIFALSRFGGLRCPSEHLALTWPDIDWNRERFTVRSPKTGDRVVPIFTELRPFLEAAREAAEYGAVHVITRRRNSAQRWGMLLQRILAKAGITSWERIFHNLRASRQTELTAIYSVGTVCRWLGNSALVANVHYLTALESDFEKAAQKQAQQTEANGDKRALTVTEAYEKTCEKPQEMAENRERRKKTSGSVQVPGGLGTIRRSRKVRHIKMRLKCEGYSLLMGCGAKSLRDCSCTEVAIDSLPIEQGLVLSLLHPVHRLAVNIIVHPFIVRRSDKPCQDGIIGIYEKLAAKVALFGRRPAYRERIFCFP